MDAAATAELPLLPPAAPISPPQPVATPITHVRHARRFATPPARRRPPLAYARHPPGMAQTRLLIADVHAAATFAIAPQPPRHASSCWSTPAIWKRCERRGLRQPCPPAPAAAAACRQLRHAVSAKIELMPWMLPIHTAIITLMPYLRFFMILFSSLILPAFRHYHVAIDATIDAISCHNAFHRSTAVWYAIAIATLSPLLLSSPALIVRIFSSVVAAFENDIIGATMFAYYAAMLLRCHTDSFFVSDCYCHW